MALKGLCTWKGCTKPGTVRQQDQGGDLWACLCTEHALQLETVVRSSSPKAVLHAWISAQGGPTAAAERMAPSAAAGAALINQLSLLKA